MIGMIGSGSWATAIVKILLENPACRLKWWVRDESVRHSLSKEGVNKKHLPNLQLDASRIEVSGTLSEVVEGCTDLVIAIPSAFIGGVLMQLPAEAYAGKNIISAIKGAVPEAGTPVSVFLREQFHIDSQHICVISGPTHAEEVALGRHTYITMASLNEQLSERVADMMRCPYLHTHCSSDIDGIERTGLVKNVYAIAAGMCDGLNCGDNLKAVVVNAAFMELKRAIEHCFPDSKHDCDDYSHLGDLMVTCWSKHSRNRSLGEAVAKGESIQNVFDRMHTIPEGYTSTQIIHTRAVKMGTLPMIPIIEGVYQVLYEGEQPSKVLEKWIKEAL